jgi:4-amino-4-deoxy-L-arabinose transferase-like glycosyltransferase
MVAENNYEDKMVNKIIQEFENTKWPIGARNKTHIAILAIITLAIGIYLISTMVLIAKDGILYIKCAKGIVDTVRNTGQAPGYPFLIYLTHKVIGLFYNAQSLQGWIISAQAVSLISKVIASIALYFVGSYFVGPRLSFWGVLILSILPDSVDYGSDALTDWPNVMFLAIGLLLLLSVQYRKNWMFGWAGIVTGLGYLIRPECGQVVLYGSAWLLFNLIRPQGKMKRTKAAGALILLLAGFAIIAIPYMRSKGYVFPEQGLLKLPALFGNTGSGLNTNMCLAGLSIGKIIGNETLITNMCETLMYYFIPALLIGS